MNMLAKAERFMNVPFSLAVDLLEKKKINEAIDILRKAKEWPENIGVGKPFQPDERAQNFLLAKAHQKTGDSVKAKELLNSVATFSILHSDRNTLNHLYGLLAFKELNESQNLEEFENQLSDLPKEKNQTKKVLDIYQNENLQNYRQTLPIDVFQVLQYALID